MKKYLLIGTGIALLAVSGVALAQMPPGGMDHMGGPEGEGPRGSGMMPPHGWEMRHRHHGSEGAAFRFKRGDMEIGIKCSEHEPTQVCVNAAATLIDRLNSNASSTAGSTATPAPAPRTP